MVTKKSFPLLCVFMFFLNIQTAFAVEIKASIDRNSISINESVQLTFTAIESPDGSPDFSSLEQDFEILNQTQQSNTTWVNGASSNSIRWVLNVMPKNVGNLIIPPVSFGGDKSQAILLKVLASQPVSSNQNADLFIEVEASPKSPFVQAQVLYTLRLYSKVQLSKARLSELDITDALVEKLGEVKKYQTTRNGIEYAVNELNYAVFPQKSGKLEIAPMVLSADVVSSSRQRQGFNGFFNRQISKTKRVLSNAISLDVQAVPDAFKGKNWLPASHVIIEDKWSADVKKMKVGEPLTRTLTILTVGNTVAQLPSLYNPKEIAQLKTYPDQPVLKEQKRDEGLIAFREEKIAYIPSKAGDYIIPAIEIPWFNTETQKMEVARIAEQTVQAISLAGEIPDHELQNTVQNKGAIDTSKQGQVIPAVATTVAANPFWMWLSLALACGWVLTIGYIVVSRKSKQKHAEIVDNQPQPKLKKIVKELKQACVDNNALAAKNALLVWGKQVHGSETIAAIAPQCEARLRDEIYLLNQSLYAEQGKAWVGKPLFQAFTENKARKAINKNISDSLEPLYKL